jgi:hypothetical protein
MRYLYLPAPANKVIKHSIIVRNECRHQVMLVMMDAFKQARSRLDRHRVAGQPVDRKPAL